MTSSDQTVQEALATKQTSGLKPIVGLDRQTTVTLSREDHARLLLSAASSRTRFFGAAMPVCNDAGSRMCRRAKHEINMQPFVRKFVTIDSNTSTVLLNLTSDT